MAGNNGQSKDLTVRLSGSLNDVTQGYGSISVEDVDGHNLNISFRRTIRVPDNGKLHQLPPDLGAFPIFNVLDHEAKLPQVLNKKGGVFIPIYQREAMWISFQSTKPFALKLYVGNVNAITGYPKVGTVETLQRYKSQVSSRKPVQDYAVAPNQCWLDGVVRGGGRVMQFVAAPVGSGYSVEAQITGKDSFAGIQFEITPSAIQERHIHANASEFMQCSPPGNDFEDAFSRTMELTLRTLTGRVTTYQVSDDMTVDAFKDTIQDREGIPTNQMKLIHGGNVMEGECKLRGYYLHSGDVVHLVLRLRGGGHGPMPTPAKKNSEDTLEMAIAPGGSIKQTIVADKHPRNIWRKDDLVVFNLQLFNAEIFAKLLGFEAPPTPIDAETYAKHGYPFFDLSEEDSDIHGDFPVQSVGDMDEANGLNLKTHKAEEGLKFPAVKIGPRSSTPLVKMNEVDERSVFFPVEEVIELVKTLRLEQTDADP